MVKELISTGNIAEAFRVIREEAKAFPDEGFMDKLEQCQTEFQYMADFMLQGYKDPKRGDLFEDLCRRLRNLWNDICVRKSIIELPYIKGIRKMLLSADTSVEMLQAQLLATTDAKEHCDVLSLAFLSIFTSYHWRNQQTEEWAAFLASPQTNPVDAATLTSAISLSCLQFFTRQKALCLAYIHSNTKDEGVRQRAFVGCILAATYADKQDKADVEEILSIIFRNEQAGKELLEMQMQMVSCTNVDKDSTEIRRNLMPNIIKNQPFVFTKNGIEEREEEEDVTDSDASERRMEEMEKSIRKMLKMQKNGADIFFEGFSQMKRYPFFYKMANWFMPFYMDHPDIATYLKQMPNTEFVERITKLGPFCNSDKYSFTIAFASVMNQLPENVQEMMKSGELGPIGMHKNEDDMRDTSFVRMQYLQDIYRFYRLNPIATNTRNPYNDTESFRPWLTCSKYLGKAELRDMCSYLIKNGSDRAMNTVVPKLLNAFEEKECLERTYCIAEYRMRRKEYGLAIEYYNKCLTMKRDHKGVMRNIAKAYYANGDFTKAAFYFDALQTLFPDRISYTLNYAMAMVKDGFAKDVVNDLYKLEFENPDDKAIRNTLGWTLLHAEKAEQALALYQKFDKEKDLTDFSVAVNYAYALLFNGLAQEALDILRAFRASCNEEERKKFPALLLNSMDEDADLLALYGYGKAEQVIIASALSDE